MLNTIEKLREKPERHRKNIAFIVSAFVTGIIFIVWLSVVGVRFNGEDEKIVEQDRPSLIAGVREGFSEVFEGSKERLDYTKKELENIFQQ